MSGLSVSVRRVGVALGILVSGVTVFAQALPETVEYNRDIRRLLSGACFKCHGPDAAQRQAGLRLDTFEGATAALKNGRQAIAPGEPEKSALLMRVTSADPDVRMPPPEVGRTLSADEAALLRRWIEQGAEYQEHWAWVKPVRPPLPEVENKLWPINEIDYFILARLEQEGLPPSPEADKYTLIRRLSLDLTGLPPTPGEVDEFINDTSAVAYERLVQRLLDSPRYGERWARVWLDIARYADTKGYEADRDRVVWRYRDWVIDAFNKDMPFDQFTIEQFAGDLLPNPTTEQLIATAFHRNTMTNDEGGTDNEEFRTAAVLDRTITTMQAWMGVTMECAQCHSHKYDPITNTEFYEVFAFFNQTEDADLYPIESPVIPTPTREQVATLRALDERIALAQRRLDAKSATLGPSQAKWETALLEQGYSEPIAGTWRVIGLFPAETFEAAFKRSFVPELDGPPDLNATYDGLAWAPRPEWEDGKVIELSGEIGATYVYRVIESTVDQPAAFSLGSNDGIRVWLNGVEVLSNFIARTAAPDQEKITVNLRKGANHLLMKIVNSGGGHGFYFQGQLAAIPAEVLAAIKVPAGERTEEQRAQLREYYASAAPELAPLREELTKLRAERDTLIQSIPTTPILRELPPDQMRETHVLKLANFLNKGEKVEPAVPAVFGGFPDNLPRNRLGLAKWLVSPDNPLTARVTVNRYWQQFFGAGIVETQEDFGTQGELPSHPELLDWLATEFMRNGWSMKELCRTIVTSAVYRQRSQITDELQARDPYNRLLARGPRYRLEAEMIRDQALAVSGLLSPKMYGPSVHPHQPEGVWQHYGEHIWVESKGEDKYRRGLYTFWRRTAPYPLMVAFDAPSREVCTVRRIRTNTPLQALQGMNDPAFIEAAQALARRVIAEGGVTPEERITYAMRLALTRPPKDEEAARLMRLYESECAHFAQETEAAVSLATEPLGPLPEDINPAEAASWTVVSNVILNLDELVTKR